MIFSAKAEKGLLVFSNKTELMNFLLEIDGKNLIIDIRKEKGMRTLSQNDSIHLYCEWVAKELENKGITIQDVVKAIRRAEIFPTMILIKEIVWRGIQKVVLGKESTTELTKNEVNEVYEPMSMFLSKNFQIDLPFPVDEEKQFNKLKM